MFIVFEGIDGSGTTTQSKKLAEVLGAHWTCEPSTYPTGKALRSALKGEYVLTPEAEVQLFAADRKVHLSNEVSKHDRVVCDRYLLSSLAYQGLHTEVGAILEANAGIRVPDVTFFLTISPSEAMKRVESSRTELDIFENLAFQERVERSYRDAIPSYQWGFLGTKPIFFIDGTAPVEAIHAAVIALLGVV